MGFHIACTQLADFWTTAVVWIFCEVDSENRWLNWIELLNLFVCLPPTVSDYCHTMLTNSLHISKAFANRTGNK